VILSPCVKVCVMDSARGICAGCGRTLNEIARWGSMTDRERDAIMRELGARLDGEMAHAETQSHGGA
jgi:predicted Fe-S protein YdhL (DUF1289 family)